MCEFENKVITEKLRFSSDENTNRTGRGKVVNLGFPVIFLIAFQLFKYFILADFLKEIFQLEMLLLIVMLF